MKPLRAFIRLAPLAVVVMLAGCSRAYWVDRGRDAADVVTLTAGIGAGGAVRAGPFGTGLVAHMDMTGLRNGGWELYDVAATGMVWTTTGSEVGVVLAHTSYNVHSHMARRRGKGYAVRHLLGIAAPPWRTGLRLLDFPAMYSPAYFTDFQVVAGVGPSFRVGANPGELIDFLLGWTTLDIYGDDVAGAPIEEVTETESTSSCR